MSVPLCDFADAIHLRRKALVSMALMVLMACAPVQIQGNKSGAASVTMSETGNSRLAGGLPRDPQRPFTAQTCEAAQARLAEAEAGSPLISAREMAQVVDIARHQAERLCPPPSATDN